MGVVGEQASGVDGDRPRGRQGRQASDEVDPVGVVAEELGPLDAPHYHMVEGPRDIEPRHSGERLAQIVLFGNVPY